MTPGYMNTRVESKNSILLSTLSQVFGDKMNLARIKFFGLFICALCVKTGGFDHSSPEDFQMSKQLVNKHLNVELGGQNIPADTDH